MSSIFRIIKQKYCGSRKPLFVSLYHLFYFQMLWNVSILSIFWMKNNIIKHTFRRSKKVFHTLKLSVEPESLLYFLFWTQKFMYFVNNSIPFLKKVSKVRFLENSRDIMKKKQQMKLTFQIDVLFKVEVFFKRVLDAFSIFVFHSGEIFYV